MAVTKNKKTKCADSTMLKKLNDILKGRKSAKIILVVDIKFRRTQFDINVINKIDFEINIISFNLIFSR